MLRDVSNSQRNIGTAKPAPLQFVTRRALISDTLDCIVGRILLRIRNIVQIISTTLNHLRRAILVNANSPYHRKLDNLMHSRLIPRNLLLQSAETGFLSTRSRNMRTIPTADFEFPV